MALEIVQILGFSFLEMNFDAVAFNVTVFASELEFEVEVNGYC